MLSPLDYAFIRLWMYQHASVTLSDTQQHFVESRLEELARRFGLLSAGDLVQRLRLQPVAGQVHQIVDALTVNETLFFRDQHPFDALRDQILPSLIEGRRAERRLRIWSAACSTGQEAYSLAMLLSADFPILGGWDVAIVGSDVCTTAVARAQAGRYSAFEISRGLPAGYRERFFVPSGADWEVAPSLRRLVSFRQGNLASPPPVDFACDLILMRNVLIYFDDATRSVVLDRAGRQLRPQGFLMVGGSESLLKPPDWCEPVIFGRTVCYQRRP